MFIEDADKALTKMLRTFSLYLGTQTHSEVLHNTSEEITRYITFIEDILKRVLQWPRK